jgi:antitoxin component YwqK of YwqJK toxin-antitoxin module
MRRVRPRLCAPSKVSLPLLCLGFTFVLSLYPQQQCPADTKPVRKTLETGYGIACEKPDGRREGLYREWHPNGKLRLEIEYRDGEMNGSYTRWHDNGQKETAGAYKNGQRQGLWTEWYRNGHKSREVEYRDGKENGTWVQWHDNGNKELETTFRDGVADGPYTRWYASGQKQAQGEYCCPATHPRGDVLPRERGRHIEWYENGRKKLEGEFREGEKEGDWSFWDEAGNLQRIEQWHEGRRLKVVPQKERK